MEAKFSSNRLFSSQKTVPMLQLEKQKKTYMKLKDCLSFILAILLVPVLFVLGLLVSLAIVLDSSGSPLYSQQRLGLNGKVFSIYKFRSMVVDAEKSGSQWAEKDDQRVTRVGRFLRKTRLDELPQLINILKGDMHFVGPRPERPDLAAEFTRTIPDFSDRLLVKPGLTGLAQVNGGYDLNPAQKLNYDKNYIASYNFKTDLLILLQTVRVIVTGDGAR